MRLSATKLPGVVIVEPKAFLDGRGYFCELFQESRFAEHGLPKHFVQDNLSHSVPGTLRGMHYQLKRPQGKLVQCVKGSILDVAVDIRRGSPTFGSWVSIELSETNRLQLYIPPGFAHGFCVPLSPSVVIYKCTDFYDPTDDRGVLWSDPLMKVPWPVESPILSDKDARFEGLSLDREDLPTYDSHRPIQ